MVIFIHWDGTVKVERVCLFVWYVKFIVVKLCDFVVCCELLRASWIAVGKMTRKLSKFLILFDNTNLLYFPGHFLSGRVLIELDDEA